jgi:hypothetical protein
VGVDDIAKKRLTASCRTISTCYNGGSRIYESAGYCKYGGKCESKHRVWEEGPRGGLRRTEYFMCEEAI